LELIAMQRKLYLQQPYKLLKQDWTKYGGINQCASTTKKSFSSRTKIWTQRTILVYVQIETTDDDADDDDDNHKTEAFVSTCTHHAATAHLITL